MVETIEAITVRDFVNGSARVDPKTLTDEDWMNVILDASAQITFPNKLDELKSLKRLLSYDGPYGVHRQVRSEVVQHVTRGKPTPSNVYVMLHEILPFPREVKDLSESNRIVETRHLILSSRHELFILTGLWARVEVDDDDRGCIAYHYSANQVLMEDIYPFALRYTLKDSHQEWLHPVVPALFSLMRIAQSIENQAERTLELVSSQRRSQEERLRRLSCW